MMLRRYFDTSLTLIVAMTVGGQLPDCCFLELKTTKQKILAPPTRSSSYAEESVKTDHI